MYQVKIYNSIKEIKKEDWDSLTENNVFMSYNWLKTFEETTTILTKPYYLNVFYNEKLVCLFVCYLDKENTLSSIDELLLGRLRKFRLLRSLSFQPVLMCYPRKGFGTHLVISNEVEKNQVQIIQNKVIDEVENIARSNKISICFQFVMEHETNLMKLLKIRGFYRTVSFPLNYIDINFSSFQEYKKYVSNRHPSMMKTIPREINKNRKAGIRINKIQNINGIEKRLFELLLMNHKKYSNKNFTFKPSFFKTAKTNFGEDAIIYAAEKEGEIIGVCVELRNGVESYISSIGIDHNYSKDDFTYFNIMYYEPINNAISTGVKRIFYSNALYELKSRRGCIVANTYCFYKPYRKKGSKLKLKIWFGLHALWMAKKFPKLKYISK
jgi:predicted N-acyltransferase